MESCSKWGVNYERGAGVPKDPNRANALYKQACDGGNQEACARVR
jgi:TPR repeat protein